MDKEGIMNCESDIDNDIRVTATHGESVVWNDKQDCFPLAIVWSPIPLLSWLLPVAGHLGIVGTDGVVHDFAGPYFIHTHKRRTAFGPVTKYVRINAGDIVVPAGETVHSAWNKAISRADKEFECKVHNLVSMNCHHHVGSVLNELKYKGRTNWASVTLTLEMVAHGRFVSTTRCVSTYAGFVVLLLLLVLIVALVKLL